MTSSSTGRLLDSLLDNKFKHDTRPWGVMNVVGCSEHDLTIKHIIVERGQRTSLQYHKEKDELLIILEDYGMGFVALGEDAATAEMRHLHNGCRYTRILPGVRHRVIGPLEYLEVSTFDNDDDTVRVSDDYGRSIA